MSGIFAPPSTTYLGNWLPAEWVPEQWRQLALQHIHLDSRLVKPGDGFFALATDDQQRSRHIRQAIAAGAIAVVMEATLPAPEVPTGIALVRMPNLLNQLPDLAARFYDYPSRQLTLIGVTGTNGKSTCVYLLAQLLATITSKPAGIVGTLGYGLWQQAPTPTGMTTPDVISNQRILRELVNQGAASVAMEVSSHGLDQNRVTGLEFRAAVFTNLTRDHLDYHGTFAAYEAAKARLFAWPGLEFVVLNQDAEGVAAMKAAVGPGVPVLSYSLANTGADISANQIVFNGDGTSFALNSPWGSCQLKSPLVGTFNVHNLLAVIATALQLYPQAWSTLAPAIANLKPVAGRMQQMTLPGQPTVVVDYAHTPDALEQVLSSVRRHCAGQLWLVFGCGGDRDKGKRPLMAAIAERLADRIVVTQDNPRHESPLAILADIRAGFSSPVIAEEIAERGDAIKSAVTRAVAGDWIVIAGKGHETFQLIGDQHLLFDDYAEAFKALSARGETGCV